MLKRTRNVQCMTFYEAFKKSPSDENEIILKNYWIDRKNKKYLTSSLISPRKDKKGAQDVVVRVTKKVFPKFGETLFGGLWSPNPDDFLNSTPNVPSHENDEI